MDFLKKVWPTPFKIEKGNLSSFLVRLILLVVVCAVIGILIGVLAKIPVVGILFGLVGSLVELYSIVGVVLCFLVYFDVL